MWWRFLDSKSGLPLHPPEAAPAKLNVPTLVRDPQGFICSQTKFNVERRCKMFSLQNKEICSKSSLFKQKTDEEGIPFSCLIARSPASASDVCME